jgi:hypothetical protein
MSNIFYSGTALFVGNPAISKFQVYNADNVSGYTPVQTGIQSNGSDINTILSPRDNKTGNAATSTGAIKSGVSDLTLLFNKTLATYDVTVGGTVAQKTNTPTNLVITQGVTYSNNNPTGNGVNAPSFTVPNPTVDTLLTTCSAAGTYTFTNSFTSSAISGGIMVLKAGNYLAGTINGSFTISPVTATTSQNYNTQGGRNYTCSIGTALIPINCVGVIPLPTVVSYAWSYVSGPVVTWDPVTQNTRSIGVTGAGSVIGTTTIIQCVITYTGGGSNGNGIITKTLDLTW